MGLSVAASSSALFRRLLCFSRVWIFAALLVATAHAQRINLAKYQTVAASSQNTSYVADFATDGIVSNFHSLRTNNITGSFFTLEISYPKPVTLASAHLYTGLLETSVATLVLPSYRYQYFDGANWVTITSVLGNTATEVATVFPDSVTASRFRLLGISNGVFAIRELALFPPNVSEVGEQGFPLGTDVNLNLAHKRPALASSAHVNNPNGPGFAKNAFDGYLDNTSRWLVQPVNNLYSADATIEVDLLSPHLVGHAHVYSGVMNASRVNSSPLADFILEHWDGAAWQPIPGANITGNTLAARAVDFTTPVSASRIRLRTTSASPARLQELQLYPPRTGGHALGREVVDAPPPTDIFERYSDSTYQLRNARPDLRLGLADGVVVHLPAATDSAARTEWQLLLNYRDGTYRVRHSESGLCLSLARLGAGAGTPVVAEEYSALPHQDWRLVYRPDSPERFALVNASSGLALQPVGASWLPGVSLTVAPHDPAADIQHWTATYLRHHPKKGIAATNSLVGTRYDAAPGITYHEDFYNRLNAHWSYTWNRQTSGTFPYLRPGFTYNPMQWGNGAWVHGNASSVPLERNHRDLQSTGKPVSLLGFNEPEHASQGNVPVEEALQRWPRFVARDVPLVSPAPASTFGNTWFGDFVAGLENQGLRFDYTAVHWYSAPNASSLINHLTNVYNTFGRPVWLTEFGNTRWSGTNTWTDADSYNFIAEFMWRAEGLPWLKRYSIFGYIEEAPDAPPPVSPDPPEAPRSNILRQDGTLTALGELYAGWDGVTSVLNDRAYHLHNKLRFRRVQNPGVPATGTADLVTSASPELQVEGNQWFLIPGTTANTVRLVSTRDGRRLRYWVGTYVGMVAANNFTGQSEWRLVPAQDGWFYLDHPQSGYRLQMNSAGTPVHSSTAGTTDAFQWRFVRPVNPDFVGPPPAPAGLAPTRAADHIGLSWSPADQAATYTVFRSTASTGPWTAVGSNLSGTSFTDTSAATGTTYFYHVTATSALAYTSAPSAIVSETRPAPATPFQIWTGSHIWPQPVETSSAPSADPDGDGLPNLLEYALGSDPMSHGVSTITIQTSGNRLSLGFNRVADPALTYTVEASSDLSLWLPIWSSSGSQNTPGFVSVEDTADLFTHHRRFLRLRATLP